MGLETGKKIGRPKVSEKAETVTFFLSSALKVSLENAAKEQGLTISEYVRLRVFGNTDTRTETPNLGIPAPFAMSPARSQEELDRNINIRAGEFAEWVLGYRQDFADYRKAKKKKSQGEPLTANEIMLLGSDLEP